ncbi:MAG: hypothetical protein ABIZ80_10705 [Bryobacteraceae bacterium]
MKMEAVAGARRVRMGEVLRGGAPDLQVEIRGTAPLARVEVIGSGKVLLTRTPDAVSDTFRYRDVNPPGGTAFYYVRVVQRDKQIAWSSPIWVEKAAR